VPTTTVKTLVTEMREAMSGNREWVNVPFMRVNNINKQIDSKAYTLDSLLYEDNSF